MIIDNIRGGLGNQMFQYAFGRAIQIRINQTLFLDTSDYPADKFGREFLLNNFRLNDDIIIDSSGKFSHNYSASGSFPRKCFGKFLPNLTFNCLKRKGVYYWNSSSYKKIDIANHFENIYLYGYWQNLLYFDDIKEKLMSDFSLKIPLSEQTEKILSEIEKPNSVAVHLRRTDAVTNKNASVVLPNQYYLNAMSYCENSIQKPVFFIFSDDIEDVKRSFSFGDRKIIFLDGKRSTLEDFFLLRSCKNLITANSTFSWWAGYLKNGTNSIVVTPKRWFINRENPENFLPKNWVRVDYLE